MTSFDSKSLLVNLGVDMTVWGNEEHHLLDKHMKIILQMNPEWTATEIQEEGKKQVDIILFGWFDEHLGWHVEQSQGWPTKEDAFAEFRNTSFKEFMKTLRRHAEFKEFCAEFYAHLREKWNICSAGMREAFDEMKQKGWSVDDYRNWLETRI